MELAMPFEKGNNLGRRFRPGESGNPKGRPKAVEELRSRARIDAKEAYDVIVSIMRKGDKDSARAAAAVKVLQLAGIPMSEEKPAEGAPLPQTPVTKPDNLAALEAAATEGNA